MGWCRAGHRNVLECCPECRPWDVPKPAGSGTAPHPRRPSSVPLSCQKPSQPRLRPPPQVTDGHTSVSPSERWDCAPRSYGGNEAIALRAQTDSEGGGRAERASPGGMHQLTRDMSGRSRAITGEPSCEPSCENVACVCAARPQRGSWASSQMPGAGRAAGPGPQPPATAPREKPLKPKCVPRFHVRAGGCG